MTNQQTLKRQESQQLRDNSYMFSTNQKKHRSSVTPIHGFELDHGERNPKEHGSREHTMLWKLSVNSISYQNLKCKHLFSK